MIIYKELYYYHPQRLICKENHDYSECSDPDCPFASCDTCKINYMSLDELGDTVTYY